MKKLAYILSAVLAFAACSPEEIHHPCESEAPQTASAYEPIISVDQEINQVTFSIDAKGVIPVWLFENNSGEFTEYKAQNGFKKIYTNAGDYKVRMKVMNAAGLSPDYVEKTFHIDNTIASFDRYLTFLAGGTSADNTKVWHIDGDVEGHMGCGDTGTAGTGWWSAVPGDKAAFGVYEDMLTFGGDGTYTYDPGEDGATYVNIDGVTVSPFVDQKGDANADYNVTVAAQTTTYAFEFRGNDLYLTFPPHTLFPYIDNDDFWASPAFQVLSLTRETMELVHDNGSIAWHFTLTSKAAAYVFNGFKYNAESNLWLPADAAHTYSYYYAPGWNPIADPETVQEGGEYTLTLPEATSEQWQAQFFIIPDEPVVLSADKNYDFSVIVNSNTTIPNVTFKLTDVNDDGNFLFTENQTIEAGQQYIFWRSDLKGIDAPNGVKMVFDFGRNPENTVVSLANIVLKDHAVDDGTILPGDEPGAGDGESNYTYGENLLVDMYLQETWFADANWSGDLDPQASFENGVLTLVVPDGIGGSEWQGQVKIVSDIPVDPEKRYAFFATIESSEGGTATVKVADAYNDAENAFFYDNGVALEAFAPLSYKNEPLAAGSAYEAVMVIFDFGRMPAGAEITVSDIELREITGSADGGSGSAAPFDYDSADNLWKPADAEGGHTFSQYYAPGWNQLPDRDVTQNGSSYSFTYPEATFERWQAQFFIIPAGSAVIALSADKSYDFQVKMELSQNVKGVTFKLTEDGDDGNFLFDKQCDIAAYDEFVFEQVGLAGIDAASVKMVFDFGGCPADTEVIIKDVILREHK